jgi:hypothetical protein
MRFAMLLLLLLPATVNGVAAQVSPGALAPRAVTVTAGVGNAMGWFGAQGEHYIADQRVSLFVGLGYTPSLDQGDPSGITFAGGLRGYTGGERHRAFLEGSVSQLFIETGLFGEGRRLYGPGVQGGYQFVSRGGFTFMGSVGLGYAPAVHQGLQSWAALLGLAVGYTWRHAPADDGRPMR